MIKDDIKITKMKVVLSTIFYILYFIIGLYSNYKNVRIVVKLGDMGSIGLNLLFIASGIFARGGVLIGLYGMIYSLYMLFKDKKWSSFNTIYTICSVVLCISSLVYVIKYIYCRG